ncbi:Ribosomal protein L7Ae/L8/Nhp2 family [Carpediemonas membranifera]|uniref:60S ribosomal protein L7a n=1 Tax=Carpediemonas membranifera TaxID=201153 RepID=A0A8J6AWZ6_9EUKA|nr:Ribosomal protein L7Ae/L8/Nhp2 family [Carpediemonas membranifera]|eukprot:KAG9393630.1 Ribosomal protein L7Ae/L8/Nhp2 family [Carpediemonas membranifera]
MGRVMSATGQKHMDLTRYTRFPRYVVNQRKKNVLVKRLKQPAALNMFTHTVEKNIATNLVSFLSKYKPEDRTQKKARLQTLAEAKAEGKEIAQKKPYFAKFGVNHVTSLIEKKQTKLVVIAADVDPIEVVLHLPALCRKQDIPYCIVPSKAVLGQVVHMKTCACIAITDVREEEKREFDSLVTAITGFMDSVDVHRDGHPVNGFKSVKRDELNAARIAREQANRREL